MMGSKLEIVMKSVKIEFISCKWFAIMHSFNFCSYIMKCLRLTLVAPGGTLAQPGEASFAQGGWEVRDIKQKPPCEDLFE